MARTQRRFLRLSDVKHQVGLGRSAIYQKIKDGQFPKPYPIGARAVAWLEEDVEAWIDSRIQAAGER
ncbi:helix-turn-helix transcriptional regulator [Pseudomonadota bacterium]